jgi:hypothetical protein
VGVAATTKCSSPGKKLSAALKLSGDRLAKAYANAPGKSRNSILQNFHRGLGVSFTATNNQFSDGRDGIIPAGTKLRGL